MSTDAESDAEYCHRLVRAADKDRYLASLFAPDALRPHVHALYAFHLELARVREQVSDPQLGELRLQWWRDAIEGIYGGATPDTPVARALARSVGHADLPKHAFVHMIDARQFDLYDDPMPDLATLEGYLGETSSASIQLAALVLAGDDALTAAKASGFAGVAYGLAGLLRSIPAHRARGKTFIPADLLAKRGSSPAQILSGRLDKATELVLAELRHHAAVRLREARDERSHVPARTLPAFLHVSLTDIYLKKLGRRGANPLKSFSEVSQLRKQVRVLRCAWTDRF